MPLGEAGALDGNTPNLFSLHVACANISGTMCFKGAADTAPPLKRALWGLCVSLLRVSRVGVPPVNADA